MTLLASHREWRNNSLKKPNYEEMTVSLSLYYTKCVVKKCIRMLFTGYLPCTQTRTYISGSATRRPTGKAKLCLLLIKIDIKMVGRWTVRQLQLQIIVETKFNSTFFSNALVDYIILYRLRIWVWERGNEGARKRDEQWRTREGRIKTCNDVARFTTHVSQTC